MKKHIYLAGSLFSEAEVAQRLKEGAAIREQLSDTHTYFNPLEAPINDKATLPTCADIFKGDTLEVLKSDIVLADLSNQDPGVMMELGIAWALDYCAEVLKQVEINSHGREHLKKCGIKQKDIHAVLSDIRVGNAGEYNGDEVPFGYNQYVIGGIKDIGIVHKRFADALEEIAKENK